MIDLSIIIASSNPRLAALTVLQAANQAAGLSIEIICVMEGFIEKQLPLIPCVRYIHKSVEGYAGAFAKDVGISHANGKYVVFWDDDNLYYHNAIEIILNNLSNYDIITFKVNHYTPTENYTIPREDPNINGFILGDIDTMCFAVHRQVANKILWSDHKAKHTDYHWITKVSKLCNRIKYVDRVIGDKITTYC